MEELYTPKEVATQMKLSYRKVLDMISDGEIGAIKVPGGYRVTQDHIDTYYRKNELDDNR